MNNSNIDSEKVEQKINQKIDHLEIAQKIDHDRPSLIFRDFGRISSTDCWQEVNILNFVYPTEAQIKLLIINQGVTKRSDINNIYSLLKILCSESNKSYDYKKGGNK